jgi:micrococcal nuclease
MSKDKLYHYKANLERVVDGDTIDVVLQLGFDINMKARIRFAGINAPESRTRDPIEKEAGLAAKRYVENWCSDGDNQVIVETQLDEKGKFGTSLTTFRCRSPSSFSSTTNTFSNHCSYRGLAQKPMPKRIIGAMKNSHSGFTKSNKAKIMILSPVLDSVSLYEQCPFAVLLP